MFKFFKTQWHDIKGNAKWDFVQWGAIAMIPLCVAIIRFIQHAPFWQVLIHSTDKTASIQIERLDYEHFTNFAFTVSFGGERVTNESVVFTGISDFIQSLQRFERSRAGSALLDGTEDCRVSVEADGQAGHAWLAFQVARTLTAVSQQTGRSRLGRITLSGSFPVPGEFIAQMVHDFSELLMEA
ncbi:MAG TPA: hypothetical protein VE344_01220 [Methylomirabilota bacterium]|nr:hypothetical protein [Methylomirabilota bacterium]